jgi:hypothetical protein
MAWDARDRQRARRRMRPGLVVVHRMRRARPIHQSLMSSRHPEIWGICPLRQMTIFPFKCLDNMSAIVFPEVR